MKPIDFATTTFAAHPTSLNKLLTTSNKSAQNAIDNFSTIRP